MSKFKLTQTAAEVQGILNNCNGLKSDAEGNLTVNKNLGVDGKLKLKSLVSASNPDGDITKELGGGGDSTLYRHFITLKGTMYKFTFNYYNKNDSAITYEKLFQILSNNGISGNGYFKSESGLSFLYGIINEGNNLIGIGIKTNYEDTRLNLTNAPVTDIVSQII